MGNSPKDYDIASSATPKEVEKLFHKTIPVGAKFGVMLVLRDGMEYEVATFREDGPYVDGRHPEGVSYSSIEEDAKRRDFTINGMFYDPVVDKYYDYVGGKDDLKLGIIRSIGKAELRFAEDYLRMLRAVRFSARFKFALDEEVKIAIQKMASKIHGVSAERIGEEILKIITGPNADLGLELLNETGLLNEILPEIEAMKGVEQPPQYHPEGDVWVHVLLMFKLAKEPNPALALSILLHDVGKPPTFERAKDRIRFNGHDQVSAKMTRDICKRYRYSNDLTDQVKEIVVNHMNLGQVKKMRDNTLKRVLRRATIKDELELHRIDCLASHGDLSCYDFLHEKQMEFKVEDLKPKPLVRGKDLILQGFKPGPLFTQILTAVEDEQLLGRLKDRDSALAWVKSEFQKQKK